MTNMEMPIISRRGYKGGRFIDGMYTTQQGSKHITGISIIKDSGICLNHDLIISKIDLGLEQYAVDMATEERIDFRSIMNIPVHMCHDNDHPTLNINVFKGADFKNQSTLYKKNPRGCQKPRDKLPRQNYCNWECA
jgi:hypothetical protein